MEAIQNFFGYIADWFGNFTDVTTINTPFVDLIQNVLNAIGAWFAGLNITA